MAEQVAFIEKMFKFVDDALAGGGSVLVHCLAGAHADQPSSIGETVPSGTRPAILSSTGSGVKCECRVFL